MFKRKKHGVTYTFTVPSEVSVRIENELHLLGYPNIGSYMEKWVFPEEEWDRWRLDEGTEFLMWSASQDIAKAQQIVQRRYPHEVRLLNLLGHIDKSLMSFPQIQICSPDYLGRRGKVRRALIDLIDKAHGALKQCVLAVLG